MGLARGMAVLGLGCALATSPLFGQTGGAISGRVADESGAPLPGVSVEAKASPGADLAAITDRTGSYTLSDLPAEVYRLSFRLAGFGGMTHDGVRVSPGRIEKVDAVLHLAVTADVVVTAKKTFTNLADVADTEQSLIGIADAASQGAVSGKDLDTRPVLRPGDVLESVPGMVVSQHSGEGKANQYYLRGFNLDHGTDFATSVTGIPVNMPSHAHGQGYSDLNFVIPELISGVQYEKGPYLANQGDFATAGSAQIGYVDSLEKGIARVSGGEDGYARALAADSRGLFGGSLLWGIEAARNDGPWVHPDGMRKSNGILRFSSQGPDDAFSVTAMGYSNRWNSTDQIPERAVASGLISRFGAIDPTDGGDTSRWSLSTDWQKRGLDSLLRLTAYAVDYRLSLFSNFTYDLEDPVHGDQFEQVDRRVVTGVNASQQWLSNWLGLETSNTLGIQVRNDNVAEDGLFHTQAREVLETVRLDHVTQTSLSAYFENSERWSEKVRTVAGVREDFYRFRVASDNPANSGTDHEALFSPKLSVVLGPWAATEFYANAGYGFHSNDARGATITEDPKTHEPAERVTPLVREKGVEAGLRTVVVPRLQTTLSLWRLDSASELLFTGDAGTTEPSRPSRRTGVEFANHWSPLSGLVLDADLALSKARFTDPNPAGDRIPGAVESVLSAGISEDDVAGFFGSLRLRYFGPRPLVEDNGVRSRPSTLVSAQVGREVLPGARLALEVFNVFDANVSDVDYYYVSRLPGEPASGVADIHSHPAGPRSARVFLSYAY
jgi:hypothetical protein